MSFRLLFIILSKFSFFVIFETIPLLRFFPDLFVRQCTFFCIFFLHCLFFLFLGTDGAAVNFTSLGSNKGLVPAAENSVDSIFFLQEVHLDLLGLGDLTETSST
jgi:hypothetical protein